MRAASVLALNIFLLASGTAGAHDQPFASIEETFWRPADSGFADGAILMVSSDTLALSTPCYFVRHVFDGDKNKPHFDFRANYFFNSIPGCELAKAGVDTADNSLREAAAFRVDGNTLMLQDVNGRKIASYTRIVPDSLELRWWAITGYRRKGTIVRLMQRGGLKPQIMFFNGTLLGTPGAGEFSGSYLLHSNQLKVSANRLCAGGCMGNILEVTASQTEAILQVFKVELTPKANGPDRFVLYDHQGRVAMELKEEKLQ